VVASGRSYVFYDESWALRSRRALSGLPAQGEPVVREARFRVGRLGGDDGAVAARAVRGRREADAGELDGDPSLARPIVQPDPRDALFERRPNLHRSVVAARVAREELRGERREAALDELVLGARVL